VSLTFQLYDAANIDLHASAAARMLRERAANSTARQHHSAE
jgi:hypothetical protein